MTGFAASVPNFFDEGSPFLRHPLLTAERTARETDFIEKHLALVPGARVLDVGCGFGRHSIELARKGYEVTGIDPSLTLLVEARKRAAEQGLTVDFCLQWGEDFSTTELFDAAICLFTSLGQTSVRGENDALVERVFSVLKIGGYFLVEVPQRATAVRNLKTSEKFVAGDQVTTVGRVYNENSHTLIEEFHVVDGSQEKMYHLKVKLYDREELETILRQAGFTMAQAYGDYEGSALTANHDMMLLLARKDK